jgi:hypothetical protein
MGVVRNAQKVKIEIPKGQRPFGIPRFKWGRNTALGYGLDLSGSE